MPNFLPWTRSEGLRSVGLDGVDGAGGVHGVALALGNVKIGIDVNVVEGGHIGVALQQVDGRAGVRVAKEHLGEEARGAELIGRLHVIRECLHDGAARNLEAGSGGSGDKAHALALDVLDGVAGLLGAIRVRAHLGLGHADAAVVLGAVELAVGVGGGHKRKNLAVLLLSLDEALGAHVGKLSLAGSDSLDSDVIVGGGHELDLDTGVLLKNLAKLLAARVELGAGLVGQPDHGKFIDRSGIRASGRRTTLTVDAAATDETEAERHGTRAKKAQEGPARNLLVLDICHNLLLTTQECTGGTGGSICPVRR